MKQLFFYLLAVLAIHHSTIAQEAQGEYRAPVVVELFTSEGCSSCPPADEVLGQLHELGFSDEQVIPLAYHVDYWNNLGWTDKFSHAYLTQRQWNYARLYRASQVYTPQMIINGTQQFVGSNQSLAKKHIQNAWLETDAAEIFFQTISGAGDAPTMTFEITHTLHETFDPGALALFVAVTEDGLSSDVTSGENQGRLLIHHAVVRTMKRINQISTDKDAPTTNHAALFIKPGWKRNNLKAAAFIQNLANGAIIGATAHTLPES